MDTNNKKSTWPTPAPHVYKDPTPPIFHLQALEVGIGGNANFSICIAGNANFSIFRYQHAGILNAKLERWGLSQCEEPTRMVLHRSGI